MAKNTSQTHTMLPFLYLKECAQFHLRESESNAQNTFHTSMSCIIFSAFTLEAFLNYIGSCVFDFWEELERHLTSVNKLNVICSQLGISEDFSQRPFQSFEKAINLKHSLNQGTIESYSRTVSTTNSASAPTGEEWKEWCNPGEARRIYDDSVRIMDLLSREVQGVDYPLSVHEAEQAGFSGS
jgi:hypothetical protein